MSHEEIIALNQSDLDRLVRWACAHEGVKLPGPEPERPPSIEIKRDLTVYKVGELHFTERDAAEEDLDGLGGMLRHDWQTCGAEYRYAKPFDASARDALSTVTTERVLSKPAYDGARLAIAQQKAIEKEYEQAFKEYTEAVRVTAEIRGEITDVYAAARNRQAELDRARMRFAEYLDLAEGNQETARKFFEKAHTPSGWVYEQLFPLTAATDA